MSVIEKTINFMKLAEEMLPKVPGALKKEFVIERLRNEMELTSAILEIVSDVIDTIINLDKKKIQLHKTRIKKIIHLICKSSCCIMNVDDSPVTIATGAASITPETQSRSLQG